MTYTTDPGIKINLNALKMQIQKKLTFHLAYL